MKKLLVAFTIICYLKFAEGYSEEVISTGTYHFKQYVIEPNETAVVTSKDYPNLSPPRNESLITEYYNIFSWPNSELEVACNVEITNGNCSKDFPTFLIIKHKRNYTLCRTQNFFRQFFNVYVSIQYMQREKGGHRFRCEISSTEKFFTVKKQYMDGNYSDYIEPTKKEVSTPANSSCLCGTVDVPTTSRIIHGKVAAKNYFTWVVSLYFNHTNDNKTVTISFCGGSLITNRHVLTAAHCNLTLIDGKLHDTFVRFQAYDSETDDWQKSRQIIQWLPHEMHNKSKNFQYDIAVALLDRKIDFGPFVSPACLPNSPVSVNEYATIIGWGSKHVGSELYLDLAESKILMEATVKVISLNHCSTLYSTTSINNTHPHQICSYMPNKSSCSGDSGGPLNWFNRRLNKYVLIGIASFGVEKCAPYHPSIDSAVYPFIDWIRKKIEETKINVDICVPVNKN